MSRFEPEHSTQEQLPLHEQLEMTGSIGAAKTVPDERGACRVSRLMLLRTPGLVRVGIGAKNSSKVAGLFLCVKGVTRFMLCGVSDGLVRACDVGG